MKNLLDWIVVAALVVGPVVLIRRRENLSSHPWKLWNYYEPAGMTSYRIQ